MSKEQLSDADRAEEEDEFDVGLGQTETYMEIPASPGDRRVRFANARNGFFSDSLGQISEDSENDRIMNNLHEEKGKKGTGHGVVVDIPLMSIRGRGPNIFGASVQKPEYPPSTGSSQGHGAGGKGNRYGASKTHYYVSPLLSKPVMHAPRNLLQILLNPFRGMRELVLNSYHGKRLFFRTIVLILFASAILVLHFQIIPQQIENETQARQDEYNALESCNTKGVLPVGVAVMALSINGILCLALVGEFPFALYEASTSRKRGRLKTQRVEGKRGMYLRVCEALVILESGLLVFTIVLIGFDFLNGVPECLQVHPWLNDTRSLTLHYVLLGLVLLTWLGMWVHISAFHSFSEHCRKQLGQRRSLDSGHTIFHFIYRQVFRIARRGRLSRRGYRLFLYRAVIQRNVVQTMNLLNTGKIDFGDFEKLYDSPWHILHRFARTTWNPVHAAAELGDIPLLEVLLDAGMPVDKYDKVFRVPLGLSTIYSRLVEILPWVSSNGQLQRLKWGQASGVKQGVVSQAMYTPLHLAVVNDHTEVVQFLLARGANPNACVKATKASHRFSSIFLAKSEESLTALLTAGANPLLIVDTVGTAMQQFIDKDQTALLRLIREVGGDTLLTPLHAAAAMDEATKVKTLVKLGADVHSTGERCHGISVRTPLHWAAIAGATEAGKALISGGVDLDRVDYVGRTALHWSVLNNRPEFVRLLIDSGADPEPYDFRGYTPLLCAGHVSDISLDILADLLNAGADINAKLRNGDTALHLAAKEENLATALSLLKSGAQIMSVNAEGKRPLDCTQSSELQFLIKKAAGSRDVMISYTHSHTQFAKRLRDALEANLITTWMDFMSPTGIGGGSLWRAEITRGIMGATVVVAVLSEDYPESEWCLKELAIAKQLGKPVLAVSCEDVKITDELQVYIYRRQIVSFTDCITGFSPESRPKNVQFTYDDQRFYAKNQLLVDGIKDEIEKSRVGMVKGIDGEKHKDHERGSEYSGESKSMAGKETLLFIAHGDCHINFARQLRSSLRIAGYRCYMDTPLKHVDMGDRIRAAKDAILHCDAFLCILSARSTATELLGDQLAFAEDKQKQIVPILFCDQPITDLGMLYSLSRSKLFHFWSNMGFEQSYDSLVSHLQSLTLHDTKAANTAAEDRSSTTTTGPVPRSPLDLPILKISTKKSLMN